MNRIERIVSEYCPDGVAYIDLGNLCQIRTGKLNANAKVEDGEYPFFTCDANPYRIDSYAFDTSAIIISGNGSQVGHINRYDGKFNAYQRTYVLDKFVKIDIEFLFHFLKGFLKPYILTNSKKGSVPYITLPMLQYFKVPVPPLEVQREIVRVLDHFTLLSAELSAELKARKQQYQHYCDELFKPKDGWKEYRLGELGTLTRGKRFVKADAVDNGIPCIHYGELYTHYGVKAYEVKSHIREDIPKKLRYAKKNDVIIVGAGENDWDIGVGVAWLGEEEVAVHDACYTFEHNQNPLFISYYLRTSDYHQQIKKYVSTGKICAISAEGLGKSIIYVPDLEEQTRIANQLSAFDALLNSISEGIPAEIEARQKQYEYYRDKLLTFKEKETV